MPIGGIQSEGDLRALVLREIGDMPEKIRQLQGRVAKVPQARVFNSAAISAASGAETVLTFDSERVNVDGIHSVVSNPSRLTCVTPGAYLLYGNVGLAPDTTGTYRILQINLNGTTRLDRQVIPPVPIRSWLSISTVWVLAAGDFVELVVQHDASGAINVESASVGVLTPEFGMVRVG